MAQRYITGAEAFKTAIEIDTAFDIAVELRYIREKVPESTRSIPIRMFATAFLMIEE